MAQLYDIYKQFLSIFPENWHWAVSVALGVLLIYSVFQIVKRNFIYLILLVVLLPASVPILNNIWESAVELIKFLLTKK